MTDRAWAWRWQLPQSDGDDDDKEGRSSAIDLTLFFT
jgi:hypothetical protein